MDIEDAAERAAAFLANSFERPAELAIDRSRVLERTWCHVFLWNSAEYLRTGDPMAALWGNGPIVVPKDGGAAFALGTHRPADVLLDEHERSNGIAHGGQRVQALDRPAERPRSGLVSRDRHDRAGSPGREQHRPR